MPRETKLLCNKCFQEIATVSYPEGIYVERCPCEDENIFLDGHTEGYDKGYDQGSEEGFEQGYDQGLEATDNMHAEEIDELKDRIHELEEITAKYSDLIDEEDYIDRLGA